MVEMISIGDFKELTALGVMLFIFLGLGITLWKVIIPRFFDLVDARNEASQKMLESSMEAFKISSKETAQAVAEVHSKVDNTLKTVTADMRVALNENAHAASELIRSNQKFTLELLQEFRGEGKKTST